MPDRKGRYIDMVKKIFAIMLLAVLAGMPAFAAEMYDYISAEFKDNASQFMCMCGCGQDHFECNMDGCGLNDSFKTEILEMMNDGMTQDEIKNHYTGMYGEVILTAPEKKGFSLTAWITPFAALGAAGAGVTLLVRRWVNKSRLNTDHFEDSEPKDKESELEEEILKAMVDEERKKYY